MSCVTCSQPITEADVVITFESIVVHKACCICSEPGCKRKLTERTFEYAGDKFWCPKHVREVIQEPNFLAKSTASGHVSHVALMADDMDLAEWLALFDDDTTVDYLNNLDVFNPINLGARIYWEDSNPEIEKQLPEKLVQNFKLSFDRSLYSGYHLEDIGTAFLSLDFDKSNALSLGELSGKLSACLGQGFGLKECDTVFAACQSGRSDDVISFVEFHNVVRKKVISSSIAPMLLEKSLQKLYHHWDKDGDGELSVQELTKFLKMMDLKADAATLVAQSDTDGNKTISFQEFFAMIMSDSKEADPAWRVIKVWLQFSSGWADVPKTPAEFLKTHSNPNAKLISFIRHGQSVANEAAETVGSTKGLFNADLTKKGEGQARARCIAFRETPTLCEFELIVVSPMQRTLRTFELACADYIEKGIPVIVHPLLREHFSESDDIGDSPKNIKAKWAHLKNVDWSNLPDSPEVWWYVNSKYTPGPLESLTVESQKEAQLAHGYSESWFSVVDRARKFEEFLKGRTEKNICVVSHGGFIHALVGPRMDNAEHCLLEL